MSSIIVLSILYSLPFSPLSSPHEKEAFKSMFLSQHAKLTIAKLKIQTHLSFITLFSYILFYFHSVNFLLIFVNKNFYPLSCKAQTISIGSITKYFSHLNQKLT